jgi:hypothetical protein
MIGKVYAIPPQPPVVDNTHWLPAGAVTIGVEFRDVNPDNLAETYGNTGYYEELVARSPDAGFSDEGVSIHVSETADGHEYLRFDIFDAEPHYHYIHKTEPGDEPVNNVVDFDLRANGDMLPWAITCLRERLPDMLTEAGGAHLVPHLDNVVLAPVIDQVVQLAAAALEAQRSHT